MTSSLVLQLVSFFLALIGLILGLYVLALNLWNSANRHLSLLFLLVAINDLAIGLIVDPAVTRESATAFTYLLGATTPAFQIVLLLLTVVLLRPTWLRSTRRWLWWPLYGLIVTPGLLTILDVNWGTQLWYTGLSAGYQGGFVVLSEYANGILAVPIRVVSFVVIPLASFFIALYVAWRDKRASPERRRLAWYLFAGQLVASVLQFGLRGQASVFSALFASTVYAAVCGYATFRQLISERRLQRGRLQVRLVLTVLAIAVPLVVSAAAFLTYQDARRLAQNANEQLRLANVALKGNVDIWLSQNVLVVQHLAAQPDIVSMDPALQKPILVTTSRVYPYLFLAHTTDLNGLNVARNDDGVLQDYSDRVWFQGGRSGASVTMQPLISRTTGQPSLNLAAPIRDVQGHIVGVASIGAHVDEISHQVQASRVGQTGVAYVIDPGNRVVAHPDPAFSGELRDLSGYAPVQALRAATGPGSGQGGVGQVVTFTDDQGVQWRAYVDVLESDAGQGWGIIVQQQNTEVQSALAQSVRVSLFVIVFGAVVLTVFATFAMRQAFQPIDGLTTTARAIAAGDFERVVPVETEDELGTLATTFNSMTAQLRDLIGSLESRVSARTSDLEQRSRYLQASAEVGRAAASYLDPEALIGNVVEVIRERFGLYYVALFLVDDSGEWAVLHAGTGQAGRAMLSRRHRIQVGTGMIGWTVAHAQARIASRAEADAVRVINPELPDTRSEAALPLRSRGQVLGALSVQSDQPDAFDEATITVLQTMADQVAVALDNARLFAESESALGEARRAYGELSERAWAELLSARTALSYRYEHKTILPAQDSWSAEMRLAQRTGQYVLITEEGSPTLVVPISIRDRVIGVLNLKKGDVDTGWSDDEIALLETLSEQLGLALESARLYYETQQSVVREHMIAQVAGSVRQELYVEDVLRTAVAEVQKVLGLGRIAIQMVPPEKVETVGGQDDA